MPLTPVLGREEYVEQAYFFRCLRDRQAEGRPAQEILEQLQLELLSTSRLPLAVGLMLTELRHAGRLSVAFERLAHYFTAFQARVIACSEAERARFTFAQATLVLEREAEYRAAAPTPQGLFVYQFETIVRNQLGYLDGLLAMEQDGFYDEDWRGFIRTVRANLGVRDLSDLVFARSEHYLQERRKFDPDHEGRTALFGEKEGKIAFANRGRDPALLFDTLQRHLGYPPVPKPPKAAPEAQLLAELNRKVKALEMKLKILEGEVTGATDPKLFAAKPGDRP